MNGRKQAILITGGTVYTHGLVYDPGAVLDTVVARAAELADADLGLAMVSADDGRVVVEAAHVAGDDPATGELLRGLALPANTIRRSSGAALPRWFSVFIARPWC